MAQLLRQTRTGQVLPNQAKNTGHQDDCFAAISVRKHALKDQQSSRLRLFGKAVSWNHKGLCDPGRKDSPFMICTYGPLLLYARRTPAPQVAVVFS